MLDQAGLDGPSTPDSLPQDHVTDSSLIVLALAKLPERAAEERPSATHPIFHEAKRRAIEGSAPPHRKADPAQYQLCRPRIKRTVIEALVPAW
jgi:hypothetical protein